VTTVLGYELESKRPIALEEAERELGLYIIGSMGTGKSTLLLSMILQDVQQQHGFCVLDPHGDLIIDVLGRAPYCLPNAMVLDPSNWRHPFGLNLLECPDPTNAIQAERTAASVMRIFKKLWGPEGLDPSWGPQLEDLLSHLVRTFIEARRLDANVPQYGDQYTLVDIPRFLEDEGFRAKVLQTVSPRLREYWQVNYDQRKDNLAFRTSTLNKVRRFTDNPILRGILGQSRSSLNLRGLMDRGQYLFVRLPEGVLGAEVVSLVGAILTEQLLLAALSRAEQAATTRRPFALYCDEFWYFATEDFARFFSEGRKFKVQTVVAHQFRHQLDPQIRHATLNVANKLAFRISSQDATDLRRDFPYRPPEPESPFSQHPLEILRRRQHVHPEVNWFIERVVNVVDDPRNPARATILEQLDQYFYKVMAGALEEASRQEFTAFARIVGALAAWCGCPKPKVTEYKLESRPQMTSADLNSEAVFRAATLRINQWEATRRHEATRFAEWRQSFEEALANAVSNYLFAYYGDRQVADPWEELRQVQRRYQLPYDAVFERAVDSLRKTALWLKDNPLRVNNALGQSPVAEEDVVTTLTTLPQFQALASVQQAGQATTVKLAIPWPGDSIEPEGAVERHLAQRRSDQAAEAQAVEADIAVRQGTRVPASPAQDNAPAAQPPAPQAPPRRTPIADSSASAPTPGADPPTRIQLDTPLSDATLEVLMEHYLRREHPELDPAALASRRKELVAKYHTEIINRLIMAAASNVAVVTAMGEASKAGAINGASGLRMWLQAHLSNGTKIVTEALQGIIPD
jgi:hypothetical protein